MIFMSLYSNKYIYLLHTNSMVKKFKHRFYIKELLFGSVKPTENADADELKCSSYGIGFDSHSEFLFTDGSMGKKCHYFRRWYELIRIYW